MLGIGLGTKGSLATSRGLQSKWLAEVKSPLRILLHAPRIAEFESKSSLSA